jgi:hypothetical protein
MTVTDQLEALRGTVPDVVIERARRLVRLFADIPWRDPDAATLNGAPAVLLVNDDPDSGGELGTTVSCNEVRSDISGGEVFGSVLYSPRLVALEELAEATEEIDRNGCTFATDSKVACALDRLRATEKP